MLKTIGIDSGNFVIFNDSLNDFVQEFYMGYHDYKVYDKKNKSFIRVNEKELENYIDREKINITPFSFYEVNRDNNTIKKLFDIENTEIPYIKGLHSTLTLGDGIIGFKNLEDTGLFSSQSRIIDDISGDYANSRAKKSKELHSIIEETITKNNYFKDNDSRYILYKKDLTSGETMSLRVDIFSKQIYVDLYVKGTSKYYNALIDNKDEDSVKNNEVSKEIIEIVNKEIIDNKEVIYGNLNKIILDKKKNLNDFLSNLLLNETIIKEEKIIKKVSSIKEMSDSINIIDVFKSESGDFIKDLEEQKNDSLKDIRTRDKHTSDIKDNSQNYTIKEIFELLGIKQSNVLGTYSSFIENVEKSELLKGNIKSVEKFTEEEITHNIGDKLLKLIQEDIEEIEDNLKTLGERYKISENKKETKLKFEKLKLQNTEDISVYNNQIERSNEFAEAISILTEIGYLYKTINNYSLNNDNINDLKEKVSVYKKLSNDLLSKYSGEGGLLMTKKVVSSVLNYVTVNSEITENEEFFYKNFLYTNTGKLLDHLSQVFQEKQDKDLGFIVDRNIKTLKDFNPYRSTLYNLSLVLNNILDGLDKNGVGAYDLDGFKISNESGNGSYYTPNSFGNFLKPFIENNTFLYQVNVLDTSAGKGTLLNFLDGENIKKIGNDINPLSLNILQFTQGLNYEKILQSNDIDEIRKYLTNSNLIITNTSSISYLDYKMEVDFFLSNPPYINSIIGSKERELKIKENKVRNITSGKVNMVEFTYKGLINKLKLGGVGMLISSARGISKIEQKLRIDSDNYLVPLYRIGISGKPFKKEGVLLAPISISGDDVYVFSDNSFKKEEAYAEFFVTLYTRLNKKDQEEFSNVAPTILIESDEIEDFNNFVINNINNIELLFNYKNYFNVNRRNKLNEINNFFIDNKGLSSLNIPGGEISEELFKELIKGVGNIEEFIDYKNTENKHINKIKYLKPSSIIKLKIDDLLDKFRKIDERLIPLTKEALKEHINSNSLKITLKSEYGLDYNGYSFKINKDSKIKKIGNVYMFEDKNITNLLTFPYPYSLHTLPYNTYADILSKYLMTSLSDSHINSKVDDLNKIMDEFIGLNGEKGFKIINFIGKLNISNTEKLSKFFISEKENILKINNSGIKELVERIIKIETNGNKENIENFLSYLRQNKNNFDVIVNDHKKYNYSIKKFNNGYLLKDFDRSLIEQSEKSVNGLKKYIKDYSQEEKINVFYEINNNKYTNSISLLNDLGRILIREFDKGNDYFGIIESFKNGKSIILKEFSCIETYKIYKDLMKVDRFFRDISHIDDKITNIDSEINYIFSDSVKDINFKTFLENLKNKIEEEIKTYDKNYIEKEELVEYIKDNIKEIKNIDLNRIIKLENDINDLEKNIKDIKNKEIKDLYLVNINALKTNLSGIQSIVEQIENINSNNCRENYYYLYKIEKLDFIKDVRAILNLDDGLNKLEIKKFKLKPVKNLFYENINKGILEEIMTLGRENPVSQIINNKIELNNEISSEFKTIHKSCAIKNIEKEESHLKGENNMLIDIYKDNIAKEFIENYKNEIYYIDNIVNFYKDKELFMQSDRKKEEKEEVEKILNYAKFLTINTNEYEKILILDYIKNYSFDTDKIDQYIDKNIHRFNHVKKENIKIHIIDKSKEYEIYGEEMAESIVMSLGVKSNYSKLYSNIFLDLESKLLRENEKEAIFKQDFIEFLDYLDSKSPYQEVIQLSSEYAELLNQLSVLRKKEPPLKDLLDIEVISDYISSNEFSDLGDIELLEILKANNEIRKEATNSINERIKEIKLSLSDVDSLIINNNKKLLPTFVQSKALYRFNKTLKSNKGLIKLLNQSEVGTGKTFTMPFYEALLDDTFKSDQISFKIFITEANLVSNTAKSLIENGKMPSEILEGKISSLEEISNIIKFIKKGGSNLILSSASLYNFDIDNIKILSKFLEKNVGNIYLYSDEATFIKNTESNSYSGYKILLNELKKTKKLRLQNYLTATPVNNDNGDFLYLLELFNKQDIIRYINGNNLTSSGKYNLYNLMSKTDNLKLGKKEQVHYDNDKFAYYYIPNIVYLLEFIRTKSEYSLENFDIQNTLEVESPYNKSDKVYVTYKKYYEELGISIKEISQEDYENPNYVFDNPLCFNSKSEKLAYNLINLFNNLNVINFDRNLNSIGLKGTTSQLYKTYYSLKPSLIESLIIESFISELGKIQKFKKISNAIGQVNKQNIYEVEDLFKEEGQNIFNNLILEVGNMLGIEMEKSTYSITRKVRKGYQEVEESTSFNSFSVEKDKIINALNSDDGEDYIFNNKLLDSVLMNIDIISYSNFKNKLNEINLLKEKGVSLNIVNKEFKERDSYLMNIYTVLGNIIGRNINIKCTREDFINGIIENLDGGEKLVTVQSTYIENPNVFLSELEGYLKDERMGQSRIYKLYENLEKNTSGGGLSERSYIIQLLEDFNTPLGAIFIEKVVRNISLEGKEKNVNIELEDKEILKIKDYIISNGNTLSGTLNHLATENSSKNINTFITTSYVNTVLNLYKEIKKSSKEVYMITGKYVKTSKEKLKVINDFDKLDKFGKTLVATSKSVEKGLSIFNALKGYTTIGDENAGALTQRIGRFRTLMDKQLGNLDDFHNKIENGDIKVNSADKKSYLENIEIIKQNKKEFFILSNKLSEAMLQTSESKNILLQKVNSSSMFKGIIDFNDEFFGTPGGSFNVGNVLGGVKKVIEQDKIKFFEKLGSYNTVIKGDLLFLEISKNINRNIKKNIENIKIIEGIKIEPNEKNINNFKIA